jgi:hypothetical protein
MVGLVVGVLVGLMEGYLVGFNDGLDEGIYVTFELWAKDSTIFRVILNEILQELSIMRLEFTFQHYRGRD